MEKTTPVDPVLDDNGSLKQDSATQGSTPDTTCDPQLDSPTPSRSLKQGSNLYEDSQRKTQKMNSLQRKEDHQDREASNERSEIESTQCPSPGGSSMHKEQTSQQSHSPSGGFIQQDGRKLSGYSGELLVFLVNLHQSSSRSSLHRTLSLLPFFLQIN